MDLQKLQEPTPPKLRLTKNGVIVSKPSNTTQKEFSLPYAANGNLLFVRFGNIRINNSERHLIKGSKDNGKSIFFTPIEHVRDFKTKTITIYGICPSAILFSVENKFTDEDF